VRPRQPIRRARRRGEVPLERGAEDRSAEARVLAAEDEAVEEPAPPGVLFAVEAQDGPGADRPRMVVEDDRELGLRAQAFGHLREGGDLDHLLRGGGDVRRHEDCYGTRLHGDARALDRKSTRLNSSHVAISYA